MAHFVDCVVVGAGVVGLAVARAFAQRGREVVVLEAASHIGSVTSSRNSEVIHAGIYYPAGSLKARSCVRGRQLLYDYCERHGVPFRKCGKLIVATSELQVATLASIAKKAAANGVDNLRMLDRNEVRSMEPAVECHAALFSPSTGILDSHSYMLALQGELEDAGGMIAFGAPVEAASVAKPANFHVKVGGDCPMELSCNTLINAAGLRAPHLAASIEGLPPEHVPGAYFAKGNYYSLVGPSPFSRLVYPVPEEAGLGVHATVDMGGQTRFGPDVEWVPSDTDYEVDPRRADSFYAEVRKYWPPLLDGALVPDYSGIRPKIQAPGEPAADFVVSGPLEHGVRGLVNMFGIESPGLTAALALAEHVVEAADGTV